MPWVSGWQHWALTPKRLRSQWALQAPSKKVSNSGQRSNKTIEKRYCYKEWLQSIATKATMNDYIVPCWHYAVRGAESMAAMAAVCRFRNELQWAHDATAPPVGSLQQAPHEAGPLRVISWYFLQSICKKLQPDICKEHDNIMYCRWV